MRNLLVLALPLGLAFAASAADARVQVNVGASCQSDTGSSCIKFSQWGLHNTCSTAQSVECPIPHSYNGSPTVTQFYITGYDRHSSQNVSCTLRRQNGGADILYSSTRNTSGDSINDQTVTWLNLNQTQGYWWTMRCSIPAVESGDYSHLTSYVMLTSE